MDKRSSPVDNPVMEPQSDPHQFTRNAWDANAEVWDARMGDEGNDFFKTHERPCTCRQCLVRCVGNTDTTRGTSERTKNGL